ncbi:MAG TPA: hypothetical protein VK175_08505 [Leadbetterella sp.]|nr:hypothetical protein [Leadbetterella sp.]
MRTNLLLLLCLFIAFSSCKDQSNSPVAAEDTILKEVAALPEITSPDIIQESFRKIEVELSPSNTNQTAKFTYSLDYFSDGKIKAIHEANNNLYRFDYQNSVLTIQNAEQTNKIKLTEKGLADYNQGENSNTKYYFKNNFLVKRKDNLITDFQYSTNGNLMNYVGSNTKAEYQYTSYLNNIRQEVLSPQAVHWTFRDTYLGNFSTNLLQKAVFNRGKQDETTLDFSYTFDQNNKVTKVIIQRKAPSGSDTITYSYSY